MRWGFLSKETGQWEAVEPENWRWEAHYSNGEVLKQFDDSGLFHQFAEIDQSRLFAFKMVSDDKPPYTLLFPEGGKLIHFYRNIVLGMGTPNMRKIRLYCFGYERNGVKVILVITPTGEAVITNDVEKVCVE